MRTLSRLTGLSPIRMRPVIGSFKHYVKYARTYTFRDHAGHVSHINATPNHPFYVKNKHRFMPIESVTDKDQLMGVSGGHNTVVQLICDGGRHDHCGVPYGHNGTPIATYNLEIYQQHTYRVGIDNMLVHNHCDDGPSLFGPEPRLYSTESTLERDLASNLYNMDAEIVGVSDLESKINYKFVLLSDDTVKLAKSHNLYGIANHGQLANYAPVKWAGSVLDDGQGNLIFTSSTGHYNVKGNLSMGDLSILATKFNTRGTISAAYAYSTKSTYIANMVANRGFLKVRGLLQQYRPTVVTL